MVRFAREHEETPGELVARICHMASDATTGDGSARVNKFNVQ